jgi:regulator of replication initiation timing
MSTTQTHKTAATNVGALLSASEPDRLKEENELLKIENDQLKRQIEQSKEPNQKPTDRIDKLEEIIAERDADIDTLKKEVDGLSFGGATNGLAIRAESIHVASYPAAAK